MNSKIEVKLIQLLDICPQLKKIMTKEDHIVNVCKIIATKIKDFDEAILIVQVRVGKFGIKDVLLGNEFSVNIISKSLRKKLGLRKPKLAPFVIRMDYQKKV
jgi:hypothetical protein